MSTRHPTTKTRLADRRGFALSAVIFAMVIMSIVAVVALSTSVEEQRTSQAVRKSAEAFYAAQSGLGAVLANWNDTTATLDSTVNALQSGGSLDISSVTLAGGASYRAEIMRLNEGGQPLFLLSVEGRDASGGGERALSAFITGAPGTLVLGGCCDAAAMVRGGVDVNSRTGITGTDTDPVGWGSSCDAYEQNDQPGIIMDDVMGADSLDISSSGFVASGDSITNNENNWASPAVVEQTLADSSFDIYGGQTLQDIKDAATVTLGDGTTSNIRYNWGGNPVSDAQYNSTSIFGPRIHSLGDPHGHPVGDPLLGTCDYAAPLNFGSPSGVCSDHFPIILIDGQVEIQIQEYYDCGNFDPCEDAITDRWYMQGLVVMDTLTGGFGSEFEFESPGTFNGIIVGKGCVELQDGSQTYGSVYLDGAYYNQDLCDGALPLKLKSGGDTLHTDVYYSECAVQEVLSATGIGEESGEGGGGLLRLDSRSFTELLR